MNIILQAAQFAARAHKGQKRKYTGRPYIEHPGRVAAMVSILPDVDSYIVAAAWLHDVLEDCKDVDVEFATYHPDVTNLVIQLTNRKVQGPNQPGRAAQKFLDRERLKTASRWAKIIKLCDRIDNVRDLVATCPDRHFIQLYLNESLLLANVLFNHDDPVNKHLYLTLMTELAMSLIA
jgi:(p)ppGpp synthase/HD superfamily hydrolase